MKTILLLFVLEACGFIAYSQIHAAELADPKDLVQTPKDKKGTEPIFSGNNGFVPVKNGQTYLLLAPVNDYEDKEIEDLSYPCKEAEDLKNILNQKWQIAESTTFFRPNLTKMEFVKSLIELGERSTDDDNIIIITSLHSYLQGDKYYLRFADAKSNNDSSALSANLYVELLSKIKFKHLLLIHDSCFSSNLIDAKPFGSLFTANAKKGSLLKINKQYIEEVNRVPSAEVLASSTRVTTSPDKSVFFEQLTAIFDTWEGDVLSSEFINLTIKQKMTTNCGFGHLESLYRDLGGSMVFLKKGGLISLIEQSSKINLNKGSKVFEYACNRPKLVRVNATGSISFSDFTGPSTPQGATKSVLGYLTGTQNIDQNIRHGALIYRTSPKSNWQYCGSECNIELGVGNHKIEFRVNNVNQRNQKGNFELDIKY
ncbi:hypothetical protein [Runella sp. SP2]|uniref:hypothetical protein n=1 Tax=Runella sp. SP2 TaxID=2268026 RepID=UPI000F099B84|nr:hypothetical protein [Runella sp. SP2]AYQ36564.1 hypothetical protein DTQ70_30040 [Runella sp. SP2]